MRISDLTQNPIRSSVSAMLQSLNGSADNLSVTDVHPDPPRTFAAAEEQFMRLLASENYPTAICWVTHGDVIADTNGHYWIRKRERKQTSLVAALYSEGLKRNLGIELKAICATEPETFARVYVPVDRLHAQYRLIGCCLKLSCRVERHQTSIVRNPLKWWQLWWQNRRRRKDILE